MQYYSQSGQDKWVIETFKGKKNGFFLDIGAYDGIQTSNTYALEKELGWEGICIEANFGVFQKLMENRPNATNVGLAVTDYTGTCKFGETQISEKGTEVYCDTLENILINYPLFGGKHVLQRKYLPKLIDYLSIDIEGGEYDALKNFPFGKYKIGAITIEHNLYMDGPAKKNQLFELLSKSGFERVVEDAPCLDPYPLWYMKPYEDWYVNKNLKEFLP